jgi:DNA repair protein RecN (Recombination protein N)
MLKQLRIQNYVLITSLEVTLKKGFVAITGETGSGKSILLDAFGLLLGERADVKSIRVGQDKCSVEAVFEVHDSRFFDEHDLDFSTECVIRREITKNGKSRAFINDTPVNLSILKALTEQFVDLHSQHENALLFRKEFRFEMIDSFSSSNALALEYRKQFLLLQQQLKGRSEIEVQLQERKASEDYRNFQLNELQEFNFSTWDQAQLESILNEQENAGEVVESLGQLQFDLDESDNAILPRIKHWKSQLARLSVKSKSIAEFATRMEQVYIELHELSSDLSAFAANTQLNPEERMHIEEQLTFLYKMFRKHQVQSVSELEGIALRLQDESHESNELELKLASLDQEILQLQTQCENQAKVLSQQRMLGVKRAEKAIAETFSKLNLEHAKFQIVMRESSELTAHGLDEFEFMFSANVGQPFEQLKAVASGGELSRVMLAIKAATAKLNQMPVLILDEIDQGVGGETGNAIGKLLKEMSQQMQLIVISHLPQIASKAEQQFSVRKQVIGGMTLSELVELQGDERKNEIALMLGGKNSSQATLQAAAELLDQV